MEPIGLRDEYLFIEGRINDISNELGGDSACPQRILLEQERVLKSYSRILEERAAVEGVSLE